MDVFEKGKPYSLTRSHWPECSEYNYTTGGHELRMFFNSPSATEIKAASEGEVSFSLYVQQPLIVLLYTFRDGIPWSDCPFSYHAVKEGMPGREAIPPQDLGPNSKALMISRLVNAKTGILLTNRVTTLSPRFTAGLHAAIREQAATPFNHVHYDRALADLYRRYPQSSALAQAAQFRCVGGR